MQQLRTLPAQPTEAKSAARTKRTKSPWRVLHERLTKAQASPVAARVALVLEAYGRREVGTGHLISSVYHEKIAAEIGMSVATVRRALRELTGGDAPLYLARGRTGQTRTIRGASGWAMTTSGVVYERIDDLDAFLAARDVARTAMLLDYETRKRAQHPDLVRAQVALYAGQIDDAMYARKVEEIDARARGRMPRAATTRKPTRCLTSSQVARFADDYLTGASYASLAKAGQKRVREYHALARHVFGGNGVPGCQACELAVAQHAVTVDANGYFQDYLGKPRTGPQIQACGCGTVVVITRALTAVAFADLGRSHPGGGAPLHDCPHEQNRVLGLRRSGLA